MKFFVYLVALLVSSASLWADFAPSVEFKMDRKKAMDSLGLSRPEASSASVVRPAAKTDRVLPKAVLVRPVLDRLARTTSFLDQVSFSATKSFFVRRAAKGTSIAILPMGSLDLVDVAAYCRYRREPIRNPWKSLSIRQYISRSAVSVQDWHFSQKSVYQFS